MKKKILALSLCLMAFVSLGMISAGLASMLGISTYAAKKVIDVIDAVSTIATIISLIAAVIGAGLVTGAIVATAKKMIVKYGKKYAAAW